MTFPIAFAKLKGAILGMTPKQIKESLPEMERECMEVMRRLGFTVKEIKESDFPDRLAREALILIKNDPAEFNRRVKEATRRHVEQN